MTDLRQAAQQALEALAIADNIALVGAAYTPKSIDLKLRKIRDSATALRTALEQQAEPVAWDVFELRLYGAPQEKQHRVLWVERYIYPDGSTPDLDGLLDAAKKEGGIDGGAKTLHVRPLYTTPPQQKAEPVADEWAKLLHYPDCWDTAAYPTLHDAVHEALAWSGCSVCKLEQQAEALQAMNDQLITGTSIMLDGKRVDPASVYKQAESAWDKPSTSFDKWWDSYRHDPANPFAEGSAAYWASAGWQGATHD